MSTNLNDFHELPEQQPTSPEVKRGERKKEPAPQELTHVAKSTKDFFKPNVPGKEQVIHTHRPPSLTLENRSLSAFFLGETKRLFTEITRKIKKEKLVHPEKQGEKIKPYPQIHEFDQFLDFQRARLENEIEKLANDPNFLEKYIILQNEIDLQLNLCKQRASRRFEVRSLEETKYELDLLALQKEFDKLVKEISAARERGLLEIKSAIGSLGPRTKIVISSEKATRGHPVIAPWKEKEEADSQSMASLLSMLNRTIPGRNAEETFGLGGTVISKLVHDLSQSAWGKAVFSGNRELQAELYALSSEARDRETRLLEEMLFSFSKSIESKDLTHISQFKDLLSQSKAHSKTLNDELNALNKRDSAPTPEQEVKFHIAFILQALKGREGLAFILGQNPSLKVNFDRLYADCHSVKEHFESTRHKALEEREKDINNTLDRIEGELVQGRTTMQREQGKDFPISMILDLLKPKWSFVLNKQPALQKRFEKLHLGAQNPEVVKIRTKLNNYDKFLDAFPPDSPGKVSMRKIAYTLLRMDAVDPNAVKDMQALSEWGLISSDSFLLSYPSLTSTENLFKTIDALLKIKNLDSQIKTKLLDFCSLWVKNHLYEEDLYKYQEVSSTLRSIVDQAKQLSYPDYETLASAFSKKELNIPPEPPSVDPDKVASDFIKALSADIKSGKLTPDKFAEKVVAMDMKYYRAIDIAELLKWIKSKDPLSNVSQQIDVNSGISHLLIDLILNRKKAKNREKVVNFIIETINICYRQNNLDAAQALLSSLTNSSTYRLIKNMDVIKEVDALREKMNPKALRETVGKEGIVPFLGPFLAELTSIEELNKPLNPDGSINTVKLFNFSKTCLSFLRAQRTIEKNSPPSKETFTFETTLKTIENRYKKAKMETERKWNELSLKLEDRAA